MEMEMELGFGLSALQRRAPTVGTSGAVTQHVGPSNNYGTLQCCNFLHLWLFLSTSIQLLKTKRKKYMSVDTLKTLNTFFHFFQVARVWSSAIAGP